MSQDFKDNFLMKYKLVNQIYFKRNRVLRSAYECEKMLEFNNNFILENKKIEEIVEIEKKKEIGENIEKLLDEQKKQILIKKMVNDVCEWVIHRRNKAVFYNILSLNFFDIVMNEKLLIEKALYFRIIFIFFKYQMMILYKLYVKLKSGQCEKFKKFSKNYWVVFLNSNERNLLYNFIKNDLTVIKMFFNEFMIKTKNFLNKNAGKEKNKKQMEDLNSICNNSLCSKEIFDRIYKEVIDDSIALLFINQKEHIFNDKDLMILGFHMMQAKNSKDFKYKKVNKLDYNKFYENIEKSAPEKLYKKNLSLN